jgi:glycosyltransferase involved in cell wall biosynthesis
MGAASPTDRPLVSIVTPTLNQAAMINDSLASVRRQTYRSFEHIVVDGGSTDGTLDALASASGITWRSEPDGGMYDAINKGFHLSHGEILGYLNSDDLLAPWALETVIEAFDAHPNVSVVYGDALELNPPSVDPKLQVPMDHERLVRYGSLIQPAVFWRRAVFDRHGGFDASLQFVGDLDYWLRLSGSERFHHVDEIIAMYLVHPGAKSSRSRDAMRSEELAVRRAHGMRGSRRSPRNVLARLSHGWAVRTALVRFVRAIGRPGDPRWARFRADVHPAVRTRRLIGALLPLANRRRPRQWLDVGDGHLFED